MKLWMDRLDTALGELVIVTSDTHLCALDYGDCSDRMMSFLQRRYKTIGLSSKPNPLGITQKLVAYLDGDYLAIEDIPVNPGGTLFQQKVWNELSIIPHGQTWTYGELAVALGQPTASRAVGMANSKNPIVIVIPCHRVIGASNVLTGYSGGVDRKRWLLEHEGSFPPKPLSPGLLAIEHRATNVASDHQQLSLL